VVAYFERGATCNVGNSYTPACLVFTVLRLMGKRNYQRAVARSDVEM